MADIQSKLNPPPVEWAQRKKVIFLTVQLEDCKNPVVEILPDKVYFRGFGGTDKKEHEVSVLLYGQVVPEESKWHQLDRNIQFELKKTSEDATFWPRLLKEKTKCGWLKTDFDKWRDEEDSEDDEELQKLMGSLGGFGDMGGMGNFGMPGGMGNFGMPGDEQEWCDAQEGEEDEAEELPELE